MPRPTEHSESFGNAIKEIRGKRTQQEFAEFLGLASRSTVKNYESGRIPEGRLLRQIAEKLNHTEDQLRSGTVRFERLPPPYTRILEGEVSPGKLHDLHKLLDHMETSTAGDLVSQLSRTMEACGPGQAQEFLKLVIGLLSDRILRGGK